MNIARNIGSLANGLSTAAIKNDINDEIEFHIACRTDELVDQGHSQNDARAVAEQEFGDRQAIEMQCRKIHTNPLIWFLPLSLVSFCLFGGIIAWMNYSMQTLKTKNLELMLQLENAIAETAAPSPASPSSNVPVATEDDPQESKTSLKGKVTDDKGNPIKGAKVFLIHKSWPNNQYKQDSNSTETGEDGTYAFGDLYDTSMQNAFLVTILADEFEMKGNYEVFNAKKKAKNFDFKLKAAKSIEFTFTDSNGSALAETDVVLMGRKSNTKEFMLYEMSAAEAKRATDDKGVLKVSNLQEGDIANFGIYVFHELTYVEHKVTNDDKQFIKLEKKRP